MAVGGRMSPSQFEVIGAHYINTSQVPRGLEICYECTRCGGRVPSHPKDNQGCSCGNIFIDIDYHRLVVRDFSAFRALKKTRTPR